MSMTIPRVVKMSISQGCNQWLSSLKDFGLRVCLHRRPNLSQSFKERSRSFHRKQSLGIRIKHQCWSKLVRLKSRLLYLSRKKAQQSSWRISQNIPVTSRTRLTYKVCLRSKSASSSPLTKKSLKKAINSSQNNKNKWTSTTLSYLCCKGKPSL